jgi:hypothetical protein
MVHAATVVVALGALGFVAFSMVRSIRNEHTRGKSIWAEFGLGLSLLALFLVMWGSQAVADWQTYTDEQHSHGQPAEDGDEKLEAAPRRIEERLGTLPTGAPSVPDEQWKLPEAREYHPSG